MEGHWSLWEGSTKKNEKKRKIERRGKEGREREREKKIQELRNVVTL